MRLKQIKLAGFKSFVDPTTVSLPSNLTSIVGPNGCGKSNLIDAVRWVMGESSAKNLRGDAMVLLAESQLAKPVLSWYSTIRMEPFRANLPTIMKLQFVDRLTEKLSLLIF